MSETLAAVLRQPVDWSALPAAIPTAVRHLLARCLERDVRKRLRDIGEARIALESPSLSLVGVGGLPELSGAAAPDRAERCGSAWRRSL